MITLDLARAPHVGSGAPAGSVLFNPGGPGLRGISFLAGALGNFAGLRAKMQVVTWNPRGSDGKYLREDPCNTSTPVLYSPRNQAEYRSAAKANADAFRACRATDPQLFANLDSVAQARDMDAIRRALGEAQLNYFGNSYGGQFGQAYARLFPGRVRTMFLDSIGDHVDSRASDIGFQQALGEIFEKFARWCSTAPECRIQGRDIRPVWLKLVKDADRRPIPLSTHPGLAYNGGDLKFPTAYMLLLDVQWPRLAAAILAANKGDASLFDVLGTGRIRQPGLAMATQCADGPLTSDYAAYVEDSNRSRAALPYFTGLRATQGMGCAGWPLPVSNPPGPWPRGLPPMLGVGGDRERHDVQRALDFVPGSVAIRFDGPDHGLYLNSGNRCVIEHANRYLVERILPAQGTTCKAGAVLPILGEDAASRLR